jgi:hypothetical protein
MTTINNLVHGAYLLMTFHYPITGFFPGHPTSHKLT